ncbi:restriction endonuclease subunit S [Bacteroides thetaiotaomicron]|uniref:Type I restriction enzyme EcoR124II protein n=5 Tax=Bacteroides thetaiotaomicron TaxID=818 RepID=A0A174ND82_BACT4|nr:restriction endonuclease subunit S [Bacteroides thetaiotaomicron]CUP46644.1 type I restriction enzyme EcoR124II protein [Bacteroides thetaiotaomicron]
MDTKALRQKILDLAIHGKLVPQDPNDEPASVLLERIKAEKERLIKEGKIKRSKKSAKTSDTPHYQNVPFEVPDNWVWCKLEDIAYVASGSTPDKTCFVENGIPYIKMYNLRNQKIDFAYHPQYITEEVHNGKLLRSRTEVGDLIMNIVGPPLGKLAIIPSTLPQANFNQAAVLIRPYKFKEVLVPYLKAYLEEMSEINSIATRGSAGQVNISLTQSQNMRIPLPPLKEIERIINEIVKYDILIEALESDTTDLQTLIIRTKSKILDLAIHGKLVPQDPNDEPAIELLKRINPDFTPCDNGHYTQLPDGWTFCRLDQIIGYEQSTAYIVESTAYDDSYSTPVLTAGKSFIIGYTNEATGIYSNLPCIIFDDFTTDSKLVDFPFKVKSSAMKILKVHKDIEVDYVAMFMSITKLVGDTHKRYWISEYSKLEIPIPSKAEQKRIIHAIHGIFTQLDLIMESL